MTSSVGSLERSAEGSLDSFFSPVGTRTLFLKWPPQMRFPLKAPTAASIASMHFLFLFPVTWGDLRPLKNKHIAAREFLVAEAPSPATWGCHAQITPMRLSERLPSAEVEMDGSTDANPKLKRKNTEEASKPEGKGAGQDEMSLRMISG